MEVPKWPRLTVMWEYCKICSSIWLLRRRLSAGMDNLSLDRTETDWDRPIWDRVESNRYYWSSPVHLYLQDRSVRSISTVWTDRSSPNASSDRRPTDLDRYTSHTYKRWDVVWHLASDRCFIAIVMLHHLWDPQIPPHFVYVAWHLTVCGVLSLISSYISSPFQD